VADIAQLRAEGYGYISRKALADDGPAFDEDTLCPLRQRLEGQGLLDCEWCAEGGRNQRFHRLSPAGEVILNPRLLDEWYSIHQWREPILQEA